MLFIQETVLVYKLETFKNCKEGKHIIIMIDCCNLHLIICIYIDIWSTVENYIQEILRPPWKNPLKIRKNLKSANPPPFLPTLMKTFQPRSLALQKRGENTVVDQLTGFCLRVTLAFNKFKYSAFIEGIE